MTTTSSEKAPDVGQLGKETLPESTFPGGRNQTFRVFFNPEVHAAIAKHAADTSSVEICGILVGKWARDADGPYVTITASIKGEAATNKFAEVTFTHETWAKINQEMDSRYAEFAIVGWYHSHPDFGIFLSDRDRFIQEHFFSGPGQVAYVVDPIRKTEGVFLWKQGQPALAPHYWVGDRVQIATGAHEEGPVVSKPASAVMPAARGAAPAADPWLTTLIQGAIYASIFLIGFLLAGKLSDFERLRIHQHELARALLFLKIRPGLTSELDRVRSEIRDAAKDAKTLAKEHLKLSEDPKAAEERWLTMLKGLDLAFEHVTLIKQAYGLSREEEALLESLGREGSSGKKDKGAAAEDKQEKAGDKKEQGADKEKLKP